MSTIVSFPAQKPRNQLKPSGAIALVGAGPGDPELLTVKAWRAIAQADVIVHDGLVDARILAIAPRSAQRINVAKQRDRHSMAQDAVNALLVELAQDGKRVVRLKGGDPFIFGRGGEELAAARAAGVQVEVVPGITAALGCAADAGMALTHRDYASAVTFVAGTRRDLAAQDWRGLAGAGRTLVVYMGIATAADIAAKLEADGMARETPAAVLANGTRPDAQVIRTTLAGLAQAIAAHAITSPALLVIGAVAALAQERILSAARPLALAAE